MAEASSSSSSAPKSKQPHLSVQDLATLNEAELNPLSPQVISRQATINIGARISALCRQSLLSERLVSLV